MKLNRQGLLTRFLTLDIAAKDGRLREKSGRWDNFSKINLKQSEKEQSAKLKRK